MKIATANGPEMNELMAKRLNMEQLEMIAGGTEEEPDELSLIAAGIVVAAILIGRHSLKTYDEFWKWIKDHHTLVKGMLTAASISLGVVYCRFWSDKKRKSFWRKVYKAL